mmetsp:Transcript_16322/g.19571  ORF Transcript_16322/g.19571 Transcript_16322/m.19571 type:complete len:106 (+) Transcript_16322:91-408(+)
MWDLNDRERAVLDEFEDDEYERNTVTVTLKEGEIRGGEQVQAEAYVYEGPTADQSQLHGTWDYETFRTTHLERFIQRLNTSWSAHPPHVSTGGAPSSPRGAKWHV